MATLQELLTQLGVTVPPNWDGACFRCGKPRALRSNAQGLCLDCHDECTYGPGGYAARVQEELQARRWFVQGAENHWHRSLLTSVTPGDGPAPMSVFDSVRGPMQNRPESRSAAVPGPDPGHAAAETLRRAEALRPKTLAAQEFERRLVAHLRAQGAVLEEASGTNARFWKVRHRGRDAQLVVVGGIHNTASAPTGEESWLVRVEEEEPLALALEIGAHFAPDGMLRRVMGAKVRVQFKSSDLRADSPLGR